MLLQCPGCHKRLSLDDKNDGKLVKCPACGQQFRAGAPATRVPQAQPAAAVKPRPAPPPQDDPGFDVVDDDYEVVDEAPAEAPPPPRPKPTPAKKENAETLKNAISPTKKLTIKETVAEEEADEEPPPEDDDEERPRKKKKKKKKKREPEKAGAWIPWAVGFGCLFLLVGGIAMAAIMAGMGTYVLFVAVWLSISIPVSTVILIVSMILSSAIAGGIEFGEIQVVIPKAMALLLIVNLVAMVPFGGWLLTFPVWVLGLMFLFRLDIWEARFLFVVNWLLNAGAKFVIIILVVALIGSSIGGGGGSGLRRSGNDKGQDAEAAYYLGENAAELRAWLDKDEKRIIFGRSREQSVKIATDLYDWGGKKVWAADPFERGGASFTKSVIVELPREKAARVKIIDYHNEIARQLDDVTIIDEGQRYVVIDFEMK